MVYPVLVITFAVGVMLALVAFLVPVFEGVFKEFGGELPKITQVSVFLSHAVIGYWWLLFAGTGGARGGVPEVEEVLVGASAVGPLPPAPADEDRHDRPAGRGRALVAHARLADQRRRAAAAGPGDHRAHRRQRRRGGSDGRRDRLGQAGRHDRRAARPGADLPDAWSRTWSASARKRAPWTRCSTRSPSSTRTRSRPR